MSLVGQQQSRVLYNSSKHSGGPLGAGGAREKDDSEVAPPPQVGEELGLEEDPVVGRKRM